MKKESEARRGTPRSRFTASQLRRVLNRDRIKVLSNSPASRAAQLINLPRWTLVSELVRLAWRFWQEGYRSIGSGKGKQLGMNEWELAALVEFGYTENPVLEFHEGSQYGHVYQQKSYDRINTRSLAFTEVRIFFLGPKNISVPVPSPHRSSLFKMNVRVGNRNLSERHGHFILLLVLLLLLFQIQRSLRNPARFSEGFFEEWWSWDSAALPGKGDPLWIRNFSEFIINQLTVTS